MVKVRIKKQLKSFLLDVAFSFEEDNVVCIFGKSGSGKTTILRVIAGLERFEEGFIEVNGKNWTYLPVQKRSIGFVFQESSLFPNMTVEENIKFAMREKDDKFFFRLIKTAHLEALINRYPHQLSGGEKQRVEIARAVARKPELLLLDEPFSALDFEIKLNLYEEIKTFQKQFGFKVIMVSHDIPEVLKLAQKVFIVEKGKIVKTGKPQEVLPVKEFIEGFNLRNILVT